MQKNEIGRAVVLSCASISSFDLVKLFRIVAQTFEWRFDDPHFIECGVRK